MGDLVRNLRGRVVALTAAGLAFGLSALWPMAAGRAPNPALLIIAAGLVGLAVWVGLRRR